MVILTVLITLLIVAIVGFFATGAFFARKAGMRTGVVIMVLSCGVLTVGMHTHHSLLGEIIGILGFVLGGLGTLAASGGE